MQYFTGPKKLIGSFLISFSLDDQLKMEKVFGSMADIFGGRSNTKIFERERREKINQRGGLTGRSNKETRRIV